MGERRLSSEWNDLRSAGRVPEQGSGRTVEQIARDAGRTRRRYPSEERRVGRKITPTLTRELVQRLQLICAVEGHVNHHGEPQINSGIVEDLLWAGIHAYETGGLEAVEENIVQKRKRLRLRTE